MAVLEPIFVVMVEGLFGKNYLCALAWSGLGWLVGWAGGGGSLLRPRAVEEAS